jgi:hypothetical protein
VVFHAGGDAIGATATMDYSEQTQIDGLPLSISLRRAQLH